MAPETVPPATFLADSKSPRVESQEKCGRGRAAIWRDELFRHVINVWRDVLKRTETQWEIDADIMLSHVELTGEILKSLAFAGDSAVEHALLFHFLQWELCITRNMCRVSHLCRCDSTVDTIPAGNTELTIHWQIVHFLWYTPPNT